MPIVCLPCRRITEDGIIRVIDSGDTRMLETTCDVNYLNNFISKVNSDFSVTDQINTWIRNGSWREGLVQLKDAAPETSLDSLPGFSTLWAFISASNEDIFSSFYERTSNLVQNIVDIDSCTVTALKSISTELGIESFPEINIDAPEEILELLNILSVKSSRVFLSGAMLTSQSLSSLQDTLQTFVSGKMVGYSVDGYLSPDITTAAWTDTQQTFIETLSADYQNVYDRDFTDFIECIFYETINFYLTLVDGVEGTDIPADSSDIEDLKISLGIEKYFHAKLETDKIQAGLARLLDYHQNEQQVILAELAEREKEQTAGDSTSKFYYEKEKKVREYRKFVERINLLGSNVVEGCKFETTSSPVTFSASTSASLMENAAHILRNVSMIISYQRDYLKWTAQRYMFKGTKTLIESVIKEYLVKNYADPFYWRLYNTASDDAEAVNYYGNTIPAFLSAVMVPLALSAITLSNIKLIEYYDSTNYFNLSARESDVDLDVSDRFWEQGTSTSIVTEGDVLSFYNELGLDKYTQTELNTFLDTIYNMGAVSALSSEFSSDTLSAMYLKYYGGSTGLYPPANIKNIVHPSIAFIPYLYNLTEAVNNLLSNIVTRVVIPPTMSSYTQLSARINNFGLTINGWKNTNDEFIAYNTAYEVSPKRNYLGAEDRDIDRDGPWHPDALSSFLVDPSSFIQEVSAGTSQWYDHVNLSSDETDKIISQLSSYQSDIISLANYKVYQYAVDNYSNHYTLFKSSDNFDVSGKIWVRLANHPISFPLINEADSTLSQINSDNATHLNSIANQAYDFGLFKKYLVVFGGESAISGDVVVSLLKKNYDDNIVEAFSDSEAAFWGWDLGSSDKFIGFYGQDDVIGLTYLEKYSGALGDTFYLSGIGDDYYGTLNFKSFNTLTKNLTNKQKAITVKYDEYKLPLSGDYHNQWKSSLSDNIFTLAFESDAPSGLSFQNSLSGVYDSATNSCKNVYDNGITTLDFIFDDIEDIGETLSSTKYFFGYTDVSYLGINASNSLSATLSAGDSINLQYFGIPSTSADLYVSDNLLVVGNDVSGNFFINYSITYPIWEALADAWGDLSDAFYWEDASTLQSHTFTYVGETFNVLIPLDPDGAQLIMMTVTYNGAGCHLFTIDYTGLLPRYLWENDDYRSFEDIADINYEILEEWDIYYS